MSDIDAILFDILKEFQKLNENIIKFMGFLESKVPSLEYTRVEESRGEQGGLVEATAVPNNSKEVRTPPSKPRKLPKSTQKIDAGAHRISTTTCNQCGGLISWDMRPERKTPLHVDENGHIKGTGDCPEWEAET